MQIFKRKTDYLIAAFVVGLILMLAFCEDANADWSVEYFHDSNAGSTVFNQGLDRLCGRKTFETGASFSVCPLVAVGGDTRSDSFEVGFGDSWGRWEGQISLNSYDAEIDGGFTLRRMVGDDAFKMSIGMSYWINQSPGSDSYLTFNLGMRYTF